MKRKFVQVSVALDSEGNESVVAVADDGTAWWWFEKRWVQYAELPDSPVGVGGANSPDDERDGEIEGA